MRLEELLKRTRPVSPSDSLRQRILEAVGTDTVQFQSPPVVPVARRRVLRLAWTAAIALLLLGDLYATLPRRREAPQLVAPSDRDSAVLADYGMEIRRVRIAARRRPMRVESNFLRTMERNP